jgi:hypothetical protein
MKHHVKNMFESYAFFDFLTFYTNDPFQKLYVIIIDLFHLKKRRFYRTIQSNDGPIPIQPIITFLTILL